MAFSLGLRLTPDRTIQKLIDSPEIFEKSFRKGLTFGTIFYQNKVVKNLTTGKFNIKTRTGRLRNSITRDIKDTAEGAKGVVGTNLVYARIQELGGKINVSRKMARFAWAAYIMGGRSQPHWKAIALSKGRQIKIPAHFYMENTLKQESTGIVKKIEDTTVLDLIQKIT